MGGRVASPLSRYCQVALWQLYSQTIHRHRVIQQRQAFVLLSVLVLVNASPLLISRVLPKLISNLHTPPCKPPRANLPPVRTSGRLGTRLAL